MFKKLRNLFSKPSAIVRPAQTVEEIPVATRPTYRDIDQAVCVLLCNKFCCSKVGVECGVVGEQTVLKERAMITRYRDWLKTQTDPSIITAYNHWLDFYEQRVNEAEQAIREDARAEWTVKWLKSREEFDKIREFSKTLPRP